MNAWLVAAIALSAAVLPLGWVAFRNAAADGVVALQVAAMVAALDLLVMAEGFDREPFADLALVLGVGSFAGTLVVLRFMERP